MNSPQSVRQSSSPAKQGAACYLKCVLHVLLQTEDFREAVTSTENHDTEFIDHHLKTFFEDDAAKVDEIIKTLDIDDVYEQRDAAEYFERILKLTSPQASQIFRGTLANKTSCSQCGSETDSDAPFWHLPLALVTSCTDTRGREVYRVVDGIEEFFRPTELKGQNQMYCESCDHKVDATITDVIKHHPDVLILLLKRFEFNYHYMSYVKTSCSVEVPYSLQLPQSQTYELYAVVDHVGDLRGGHYTATIRIQVEHKDTWCTFNDTKVTSLDYQPFQVDKTEKSHSAYLLFYKKKYAAAEEVKKTHTSEGFPTSNSETNVRLSAHRAVGVETQSRDGRDDWGRKKGGEKYAQRSKITQKKPDYSETAKCKSMRLDDAGQTAIENIIRITHTSQRFGGVEIQNKAQKNEGDCKHYQSEGEKTTKETLTEKQESDRDENVRLQSFQPEAETGNLEVTGKGRHPKRPCRVKVVDEEQTAIPRACKHSSKSEIVIRKTVDETEQDATKWLEGLRIHRKFLDI